MTKVLVLGLVFLALYAFNAKDISAQTTEFTFQGSLKDTAVNANGNYDFEFAMFDTLSGGSQIGSTIARNNLAVTNGIFAVKLDFGAIFPGTDRFLEIRVRLTGQSSFATLTPRQVVDSSPYSIKSLSAENAATAANAVQLGGIAANQYVTTESGNASFIQNQNAASQPSSNFNIGGTGTANIFSATTQYNIGANRVLSVGGGTLSVGVGAGAVNTGLSNAFVGTNAGFNNTTGKENAFFGTSAGQSNTTANFNSFFGHRSGAANTTGAENVFVGTGAGLTNTTASFNSFVGASAGLLNTTGNYNSFFGNRSGAANTTGRFNSFVGGTVGLNNTTGNENAFFGTSAGFQTTTGSSNLFIGTYSGLDNITGSFNSILGVGADVGSPGLTNAAAIGSNAQVDASNTMVLGGINLINAATENTAVAIGNTTSNFNGSPARFTVVQRAPGQWAQHVATNNFAAGQSQGLLIDAGTNGADEAFRIRNQAGSASLFSVRGDGNVGIGTVAPVGKINIVGSDGPGRGVQIDNGEIKFRNDTAAHFSLFNRTSGILTIENTSADQSMNTPGPRLMSIASGGQVIIGAPVSTATAKLFIDGGGTSALRATTTGSGEFNGIGVDGASSGGFGIRGSVGSTSQNFGPEYVGNAAIWGTSAQSVAVFGTSDANVGVVGVSQSNIGVLGRSITGNAGYFDGKVVVTSLGTNGTVNLCRNASLEIAFCLSSSLRYKTNIAGYGSGLDVVTRLRPITFDWKQDGRHDFGLGAEDVEKVEPNLVFYSNGRLEGVKYDRIGIVLINAVKEQQAQIDAQRKQIESLTQAVCSLKPDMEVCTSAK